MANNHTIAPKLNIGAGAAFKAGFFGALGVFCFYLIISIVLGVVGLILLAVGLFPSFPNLMR